MQYREQIQQLKDMGFYDDAENAALRQTVAEALPAYQDKMNTWAIHDGIAAAWKIVSPMPSGSSAERSHAVPSHSITAEKSASIASSNSS
mgnify:CR=1 FL=1